ncbi:MAG: fatty acid--CoA ligase [Alphaproteobacteria bacterium]
MLDSSRLTTLADIVRNGAKDWGDKPALIMDDEVVSYAQLDHRSNKVANGLLDLGLRPGDRVGYLAKNDIAYFEVLFGAFKAASVVVGVNWRLAGPEIAYILNDSKTRVLFVGPEFEAIVDEIRDDIPGVETIIALDGPRASWPGFEAWRFVQRDGDPLLPGFGSDDVIQLYTSGTTGHPKGVQLTNDNYFALLDSGADAGYANWEPGTVNFVCMPVFHVAGANIGLMGIAQGCANVILRDVDPGVILDLIERHRINKMFIVPAVINFLLLHPGSKTRDLSSLDMIIYGASPIAEDTIKQAKEVFGCDFVQLYGMTETCGAGTYLPPEDHEPARNRLRSCGITAPGVEVKLVDGQGNTVPPGEVGEILIKGGMVMKGYWNNPDATAKSVEEGWMRTGDAGYLDEAGYLFIYDRVKDMIVSGGENIYPAEVENALFAHPAVADAAVIGVPDEKWGEAVKAIIVLKDGMSATEEEIRAFARTRIAGYKVPKSVDFADMLPRNPSGKVLRRELRAPFWTDADRQVN